MGLDCLVSFLLYFLAPVQPVFPLAADVKKQNHTDLWWLVNSLKYVPVHFYVVGGSALLIVVVGGPIVIVYWYCCRGKEQAEAEQSRRNANRVTACGQGDSINSNGITTLQLRPPAYDEATFSSPPAYMETTTAQPVAPPPSEPTSREMTDLPPEYTSPVPPPTPPPESSLPSGDPPAYTDSPVQSNSMPAVV